MLHTTQKDQQVFEQFLESLRGQKFPAPFTPGSMRDDSDGLQDGCFLYFKCSRMYNAIEFHDLLIFLRPQAHAFGIGFYPLSLPRDSMYVVIRLYVF